MSEAPRPPITLGARAGTSSDDPSIPLLTDRIYLPALDLDIALPAAAPSPLTETAVEPPPVAQAVEAAAPVAAEAAPRELTQQELAERTEALRTAVLDRVTAALPERIDATVRELMQPAIDEAMRRLADEAQLALRIGMQELLEQAIRDELAGRGDTHRSPTDAAT